MNPSDELESTTDLVSTLLWHYDVQIVNGMRLEQWLDRPTYAAVLMVAVAVILVVYVPNSPRGILQFCALGLIFPLVAESLIHRRYTLVVARTALMEKYYFANLLISPGFISIADLSRLAEEWRNLRIVSFWKVLDSRLRHHYIWLFVLLAAAHVFRMIFMPSLVDSWGEFFRRSAAGPVPGLFALPLWFAFNLLTFSMSVREKLPIKRKVA